MNVEFGMRNVEKEVVECLIFRFSAFRIPTSEFLIPIIAAFDASNDAIFQSQVVHEASGAMIVGPLLDKYQFPDTIGLSVFVISVAVLVILVNSIVARMIAEFVDPFFLPNLDMVRFAAFSQHPRFKITNGDQANAAAEAGSMGAGEGGY